MKVYENCYTIKGAPYFLPHTLVIPGIRHISIAFENPLNKGYFKDYYIDKLHFEKIAIATDKKGNSFDIYANNDQSGIIATADEKETWRY